ncbi:unnamed protein product, partial [Owenia fusiformis]
FLQPLLEEYLHSDMLEKTSQLVWGILALIATCTDSAEGCTCYDNHPQQKFCESDFVIKGAIRNVKQFGQNDRSGRMPRVYVHKVRIHQIFKSTYELPYENIRIVTPQAGSECGFFLDASKTEFVFMGNFNDNGEAVMNRCSFYYEWDKLTLQVRRYIERGTYANQCNCCQICLIGDGDCKKQSTCQYIEPGITRLHTCQQWYSYCGQVCNVESNKTATDEVMIHHTCSCQWHVTDSYSRCMEENLPTDSAICLSNLDPEIFNNVKPKRNRGKGQTSDDGQNVK